MASKHWVTPWRVAAYRRKFFANREEHLFMGSFESFAAAQAAIPAGLAIGYDDAAAARAMYSHQIYSWDYPALFWIERAIGDGMRSFFDLGGHVGIKYYAFRRVVNYPAELRWRVCDLPAVVQVGRELAIQREATAQLSFCTDWREASGFDVLYASGSLQYLPQRIGEMLAALSRKPRRIVLNTTAVHPEQAIHTLNSIGFAVCPYRIQQHDQLIEEIVRAGYGRVDAWRNEGKPIAVPFVEGGDKPYYMGCCFDRR